MTLTAKWRRRDKKAWVRDKKQARENNRSVYDFKLNQNVNSAYCISRKTELAYHNSTTSLQQKASGPLVLLIQFMKQTRHMVMLISAFSITLVYMIASLDKEKCVMKLYCKEFCFNLSVHSYWPAANATKTAYNKAPKSAKNGFTYDGYYCMQFQK